MSKQKKIIDFMKLRYFMSVIIMGMLSVALVILFVFGINWGLDFTGGTLVELQYEQDVSDLSIVKGDLRTLGFSDAVVQYFGTASDVIIRIQGDEPQLGYTLAQSLSKQNHLMPFTLKRVEFIGPQVGDELRDQGGIAVIVSAIGILLYLAFRFQWKFGIGATLALVPDIILTLGILSFLQIQFDLTVLAAILALIGYSLNDTIIVYDRIRENFRILRNVSLIENINISLSQTLMRTLATSISTALALVSMLIFGGEVLFGFSFVMLVGIIIGTFSSIYVATVLLIWLELNTEDLIHNDNDTENSFGSLH